MWCSASAQKWLQSLVGISEPLQRLGITSSAYESKGFGGYKILSVRCYIILWLFLKRTNLLQSIVMGKKGCSELVTFLRQTTAMGLTLVNLTASEGWSIPCWVRQSCRLSSSTAVQECMRGGRRAERGVCLVSTGFVGHRRKSVFLAVLNAVVELD